MLENIITIFKGTTFYSFPDFIGVYSVKFFGIDIGVLDLMILSIAVVVLLSLVLVIKKTKIGLAIRAASLDITTCGLMGANTNLIIVMTFFIAGSLAGISGVFLGISYTLFPQIGQLVVKGFIASVIGGLGSLGGAVVGAILLGVMEVMLVTFVGAGLSPVIIFIFTLAFLMIRPRGISGIIVQEKA